MLTPENAIETVRKYWDAVSSRDFDECERQMAEDIVRIGPRSMEVDTTHGRAEYAEFIRRVISAMPSYHNVTHDITASPDGRRVYLHCTEWSSPGAGNATEVEVPLVILCEMNDQCLIKTVDIYWKTPSTSVDWTLSDQVLSD
jgi:limonene-1,2-epoxide hydrolase